MPAATIASTRTSRGKRDTLTFYRYSLIRARIHAVMNWVGKTIDGERRRLERARRRFIDEPDEERLHELRTRARRLRSFLEAVAELEPRPKLLRRLKRAAALTDAARDAAILLALVENAVDETERVTAEPLLEQLRERERTATSEARRLLRRIEFA